MSRRWTKKDIAAYYAKRGKKPPASKPARKNPCLKASDLRRPAKPGELLEFIIQDSPGKDSVNKLLNGHWSIAYQQKKQFYDMIGWSLLGQDAPVFEPPVLVQAKYYALPGHDPDPSNLGKALLDGLQHHGIIRNDDMKHLLPFIPEVIVSDEVRIEVFVCQPISIKEAMDIYEPLLTRITARTYGEYRID